ncbi:MAG: hypothetical protein ACNA7O_17560 [Rhodobacterales bacterium]
MARVMQRSFLGVFLAIPLSAKSDQAPPPPYLMTGANTVTIAVEWDAESLVGVVPEALESVENLSGGINVYFVEGGTGITPYSSAYAYLDVKDPANDGATARHILGGWYGPDPKVSLAMQTYFAAPVETGASTQNPNGNEWIGRGGDETGTIRACCV